MISQELSKHCWRNYRLTCQTYTGIPPPPPHTHTHTHTQKLAFHGTFYRSCSFIDHQDISIVSIYPASSSPRRHRSIVWMLIGPCTKLTGKVSKRHPLYISGRGFNNRSIDFWGPCMMMSLYGLVLWVGRVRDIPWIYVIWSITATLNHLITRVWHRSSLMIHVALLGYSVTSMIPFAAVILMVRMPIWVATLLEMVSVVWASSAAIMSYSMVFSVSPQNRPRLKLLYPLVILMEMYLISLIPIKYRK